MKRFLSLVMVLALVFAMTAACAEASYTSAADLLTWSWDDIEAAAKEEGEVTFAIWSDEAEYNQICSLFTDRYGILPKYILDASPFHTTMFFTQMASIGMPAVNHHIYNFGTLPAFIAFGAKRHAYELNRRGEMVDKKYVDCKFVLDEGIVDGHYWAQMLLAYRYMFEHPEMLLSPPSKVVEDIA